MGGALVRAAPRPTPAPRRASFDMMRHDLDKVPYGCFVDADDLIGALLRAVYDDGPHPKNGGDTVCFTHLQGDRQYLLAQYGTMRLDESGAAADSVCQHNRGVGNALAVGNLTLDPDTRASCLVVGPPFLRAYVGLRLTATLSLLWLSQTPTNAKCREKWLKSICRFAPVAKRLIANDTADGDQDALIIVVDADDVVVEASKAAVNFLGLEDNTGSAVWQKTQRQLEQQQTQLFSCTYSCCAAARRASEDASTTGLVPPPRSSAAIGANVFELFAPASAPAIRALLDGAASTAQRVACAQSGRVGDIQCERRNRVTRLHVFDATLRLEVDATKHALDSQRMIVGQLAHELRNKYTPAIEVMESVSAAVEGNDSPARSPRVLQSLKDQIHDVKAAISLLREGNQLIETRLAISKMQRGIYESLPHVEELVLRDYLRAFVDAYVLRRPPRAQVSLSLVDDDAHLLARTVQIDTLVLEHVLTQLLDNSVKFTDRGAIEVRVHEVDDARKEVVLGVQDTGPGIPEELRGGFFDTEVLAATARGNGLGIASSCLFLQAVDGTVWLEATRCRDAAASYQNSPTAFARGGYTDIRFRMPFTVDLPLLHDTVDEDDDIDARYASVLDPTSRASSVATPADDDDNFVGGGATQENIPPLSRSGSVAVDEVSDSGASGKSHGTTMRKRCSGRRSRPSLVDNPHIDDFFLVEDSELLRRLIRKKLISALGPKRTEKTQVHEFDTVEKAIAYLQRRQKEEGNAALRSSIVSIDHNLQSKGGVLTGSDLIVYLTSNGYEGTMISCTGDDDVAQEHRDLGADVILGKPLPPMNNIRESLQLDCDDSSRPSFDSSRMDSPPSRPSDDSCRIDSPPSHAAPSTPGVFQP